MITTLTAQSGATACARPAIGPHDHDRMALLIDGVRRLATQGDLQAAAAIVAETATELAQAVRARCYFVHAEGALLWTADGEEHSTSGGIAGEAVRSQSVQLAPIAHRSAVYRREIDDPAGAGTERLLAQPIVSASGETHAVVVIARPSAQPCFSPSDLELLALWAQQVAPLLQLLHFERVAIEEQLDEGMVGTRSLYRDEALHRLAATTDELGVFFERLPGYLHHSHLLAAFVLVACGLLLCFARVTEYANGPAFIVAAAHDDVASTRAGVVESVPVVPGERVEAGQVVAKLSAEVELAELARAQDELERAVLARLRTPTDRALELTVAEARVGLTRAKAGVESVSLRASTAGRIGDIRVEPGRAIEPGQVVLTITDDRSDAVRVRALVSGRHRPAIEIGQRLRFELDGFASAVQESTVVAVTDEVLGVQEIQRVVGPHIADVLDLQGPVVMVEARLDSREIEAEGRSWTLHDGMLGEAAIPVRRKPLAYLLLPALEEVLGDG